MIQFSSTINKDYEQQYHYEYVIPMCYLFT